MNHNSFLSEVNTIPQDDRQYLFNFATGSLVVQIYAKKLRVLFLVIFFQIFSVVAVSYFTDPLTRFESDSVFAFEAVGNITYEYISPLLLCLFICIFARWSYIYLNEKREASRIKKYFADTYRVDVMEIGPDAILHAFSATELSKPQSYAKYFNNPVNQTDTPGS